MGTPSMNGQLDAAGGLEFPAECRPSFRAFARAVLTSLGTEKRFRMARQVRPGGSDARRPVKEKVLSSHPHGPAQTGRPFP